MNEENIDFWEYLDNGKYTTCHKILTDMKISKKEKAVMRVAIYFRELEYEKAYKFAVEEENECSNYIKGFTAFKLPRNMKKEEWLPNIVKCVDSLETAKKIMK